MWYWVDIGHLNLLKISSEYILLLFVSVLVFQLFVCRLPWSRFSFQTPGSWFSYWNSTIDVVIYRRQWYSINLFLKVSLLKTMVKIYKNIYENVFFCKITDPWPRNLIKKGHLIWYFSWVWLQFHWHKHLQLLLLQLILRLRNHRWVTLCPKSSSKRLFYSIYSSILQFTLRPFTVYSIQYITVCSIIYVIYTVCTLPIHYYMNFILHLLYLQRPAKKINK